MYASGFSLAAASRRKHPTVRKAEGWGGGAEENVSGACVGTRLCHIYSRYVAYLRVGTGWGVYHMCLVIAQIRARVQYMSLSCAGRRHFFGESAVAYPARCRVSCGRQSYAARVMMMVMMNH